MTRLEALKAERDRRKAVGPTSRLEALKAEKARREAEREEVIDVAPVPPTVPPAIPPTPERDPGILDMIGAFVSGARTAEDVKDPRVTEVNPDYGFLDVTLPIAGGMLGAAGGSVLGPAGTLAGGAAGAGLGQSAADLVNEGEVDVGNALLAAAMGAIPGAALPVGRVGKEFLPDAAGALVGSGVGALNPFAPGVSGLAGAVLGRGAAAQRFRPDRALQGDLPRRFKNAITGTPQ